MKHFLCHRRGLPDVTIGFFGGIGGCDGAAPSALAAAGSGLRILHSRFRRFSLRLRCSGFGLAARGFDFVAHGFGCHGLLRWVRCFSLRLGCSGFRLRCLPRWVRCSWFRLGCPGLRPSSLAALGSLLLASAWLLVVSASAACRAEFAASRFGFRRLPHWVRCSWFRPGCSWFRLGCPGFGCHGLPR